MDIKYFIQRMRLRFINTADMYHTKPKATKDAPILTSRANGEMLTIAIISLINKIPKTNINATIAPL